MSQQQDFGWTVNTASRLTSIYNGAYTYSLGGGPVGVFGSGATHVTISNSSTIPAGPSGPGGYSYTSPAQWGLLNGANSGNLKVSGDAEFDGDVKIKGKSIVELLEKLENRLGIIHPNKELEEKWEELSQLAVRYKELEAEIKDKEKMWAILKR